MDSLREDALRRLMSLRYAAGDRSGALADFEAFNRHVREELDTDPMPETIALREAIRRDDGVAVQPGAPAPSQAGAGFPFVGRRDVLRSLRRAWESAARGHGATVLLSGEAGIGKTRSIGEFAAHVAAQGGRVAFGATSATEAESYQPIVEALRGVLPLLRFEALDARKLAVLATLLPEVRDSAGSAPPRAVDRQRARASPPVRRDRDGFRRGRCKTPAARGVRGRPLGERGDHRAARVPRSAPARCSGPRRPDGAGRERRRQSGRRSVYRPARCAPRGTHCPRATRTRRCPAVGGGGGARRRCGGAVRARPQCARGRKPAVSDRVAARARERRGPQRAAQHRRDGRGARRATLRALAHAARDRGGRGRGVRRQRRARGTRLDVRGDVRRARRTPGPRARARGDAAARRLSLLASVSARCGLRDDGGRDAQTAAPQDGAHPRAALPWPARAVRSPRPALQRGGLGRGRAAVRAAGRRPRAVGILVRRGDRARDHRARARGRSAAAFRTAPGARGGGDAHG